MLLGNLEIFLLYFLYCKLKSCLYFHCNTQENAPHPAKKNEKPTLPKTNSGMQNVFREKSLFHRKIYSVKRFLSEQNSKQDRNFNLVPKYVRKYTCARAYVVQKDDRPSPINCWKVTRLFTSSRTSAHGNRGCKDGRSVMSYVLLN